MEIANKESKGKSGRETVSLQSVVTAAQHLVSCDLAGEAAILHMESGIYYGLNEVGAQIWNLIQRPKKIDDVCDAIFQKFEVEAEQCQKDVLALLQDMLNHKLIEVRNDVVA